MPKPPENGQQAVGEHLLFAVALVQAKADDGVGHAHRDKGMSRFAYWLRIFARPRSAISAMA